MHNDEANQAQHLFEKLEGIDISPASGVATAALMQAVETNLVDEHDAILLNITSGGVQPIKCDYALHYLHPSLTVSPDEIQIEIVKKRMEKPL